MKSFIILILFISFVCANDNIVHKHKHYTYSYKNYSADEHGYRIIMHEIKRNGKIVITPELELIQVKSSEEILFPFLMPAFFSYTERMKYENK